MHNQNVVPDKFTLSGDHLDRLREALKVAGHQARVAQHGGYGRNIEDALADIEEAIGTQLARIETALDDDKAEAEDTAEALRARRAWFPSYRAA
jgi:hypothetical protein